MTKKIYLIYNKANLIGHYPDWTVDNYSVVEELQKVWCNSLEVRELEISSYRYLLH